MFSSSTSVLGEGLTTSVRFLAENDLLWVQGLCLSVCKSICLVCTFSGTDLFAVQMQLGKLPEKHLIIFLQKTYAFRTDQEHMDILK